MITRIELHNFMSHEHTVIEPAAGLTVLIGPNNCGKSAVVAALQILCRNENSTYVLRHNQRECKVAVETDDGHTVQWRRKNSPSYVIDGRVYDRLRGQGVPDELHQALRLPLVDGGAETDFDVHFGAQKSPIFLLASSAANAARFFASSSDVSRLLAMQKRHKEKFSDAQKQKIRLDAESQQLSAELEALEPAVQLDDQLKQAEQLYREVVWCSAWLHDAQKHLAMLESQASSVEQHAAEAAALFDLSQPPQMAPADLLAHLLARLEAESSRCETTATSCQCLAMLPLPPELSEVAAVERLIHQLEVQANCLHCLEQTCGLFRPLTAAPVLTDTGDVARLIESMNAAEDHVIRGEAIHSALVAATPLPELPDEKALQRIVELITSAEERIACGDDQVGTLAEAAGPPAMADTLALGRSIEQLDQAGAETLYWNEQLQAATSALEIIAAELRDRADGALCPLCGSPLEADRLVAVAAANLGGHSHG